MFLVLVLSVACAGPYGPPHDEVLVADLRPSSVEEAAPEPIVLVEPSGILEGGPVIDLHQAPPVMPAPTASPVEPAVQTAEARNAVTVEARTRE